MTSSKSMTAAKKRPCVVTTEHRGAGVSDYADSEWAGRLSACVRMLLETPDDASMRVAAKALAEWDAYAQARRVRLAEWVDQQSALADRETA